MKPKIGEKKSQKSFKYSIVIACNLSLSERAEPGIVCTPNRHKVSSEQSFLFLDRLNVLIYG
jgi:hypothetical protein